MTIKAKSRFPRQERYIFRPFRSTVAQASRLAAVGPGKNFLPADEGVLTLEASLSFTVLIIILGALLSLFGVLNRQIETDYTMDRLAEAGSGLEYVLSEAELSDSLNVGLLGNAVSTENDEVYIAVTYADKASFLPFSMGNLLISQQVCRRSWTGRTLKSDTSADKTEAAEGTYVYVAENGTVYHCSESCTYLNPVIITTTSDKVKNLRNKDGGKYYPCPYCGGGTGTVYITGSGTRYHSSTACSRLKRTYKRILLSETDLPACSKCGGNTE